MSPLLARILLGFIVLEPRSLVPVGMSQDAEQAVNQAAGKEEKL
jgi:hypothetical protein